MILCFTWSLYKLDFVFDKEDKYLTHIANFGNDEQIIISSWEEDDFTLSKKSEDEFGNTIVKPEDIVESTILKLYNPLTASINENTTLWISKLLTNPLIETIVLSEQDDIKCPPIKGPNFSVEVDFVVGQSTNYESLDNLILSSSASSSTQLISSYLSSSLVKLVSCWDSDTFSMSFLSSFRFSIISPSSSLTLNILICPINPTAEILNTLSFFDSFILLILKLR